MSLGNNYRNTNSIHRFLSIGHLRFVGPRYSIVEYLFNRASLNKNGFEESQGKKHYLLEIYYYQHSFWNC